MTKIVIVNYGFNAKLFIDGVEVEIDKWEVEQNPLNASQSMTIEYSEKSE